MNKSQSNSLTVAAAVLAVGLLGLGLILKSAAIDVKNMERTVTVKGLAEIEVAADTVIWPLQFSDADNDLEKLVARIEQKNDAVIAFLKLHGFDDDEISRGAQSIVDKQAREYGAENQQFRYIARASVTVYSSQPDKVKNALAKVGQLAKQGIAIVQDSYDTRIEYLFTGLNDVKPAMVQEATEKAREVAIKFAKDSQSKLGKIKTARQGQFSISNRDSNTPQLKKIRVVTSVEYYLSD
ncbi:SIMPL domain-containing protein [Pseudoalteromonas sp. NEC-BIFX-2020_015]|uniref:SIMPL domain-containing protein n=1 Tax=Pseudoalteromonas sp. NEC-BIFX-2020_015 TaxID=2729544 RepID=UPI0014613942|nr:SIMPL domain-containing protein [Pseudoalteromonas sp. NEC-BIFX-2020_015]NMR24780.1 SIMPL domain-containing protein [Pseudoalteromonas sp. NEC-BIFX-2020_015]